MAYDNVNLSYGCSKRGFKSKADARDSVKHMHQSVRVYRCESCGLLHVTKSRTKNPDDLGRKPRRRDKSMLDSKRRTNKGARFVQDDYSD